MNVTNKSCQTTQFPPKPPPCTLGVANDATKVGLTSAYVVVMVLALAGNSLIIHIARTKRRLRKVAFNYLIISMATADIIDALIVPPSSIWFLYKGGAWFQGISGIISCKAMHFLMMVSLNASVFTLTVIAFDRYMAIVHVFKKPFSANAVKVAAAASWFMAMIVSSPYLYRFTVIQTPDGAYICASRWDKDPVKNFEISKYDSIARFILTYALPLILMAVLYSFIVHVLKKRSMQLIGNVSQGQIQHQNRMVVKMLVTLVLIFAFFWLPAHVTSFLIVFNRQVLNCIPISFLLFTYWLAHANSAINPSLYVIFNENFRKGLIECLCAWRRRSGQLDKGTNLKVTGQRNPACDTQNPEGRSRGTATTDGAFDTRL